MTEYEYDYEKTVKVISVGADENIQEFNDTLQSSSKFRNLSAADIALITIARQLGALVQIQAIDLITDLQEDDDEERGAWRRVGDDEEE